VAFDASGNLLITDRDNNRVRLLDLGTSTVSTRRRGDVRSPRRPACHGERAREPRRHHPADGASFSRGRLAPRAIDAQGNLVTLAGDGINASAAAAAAVDAQFRR
jgi:hypothetical protein